MTGASTSTTRQGPRCCPVVGTLRPHLPPNADDWIGRKRSDQAIELSEVQNMVPVDLTPLQIKHQYEEHVGYLTCN